MESEQNSNWSKRNYMQKMVKLIEKHITQPHSSALENGTQIVEIVMQQRIKISWN